MPRIQVALAIPDPGYQAGTGGGDQGWASKLKHGAKAVKEHPTVEPMTPLSPQKLNIAYR